MNYFLWIAEENEGPYNIKQIRQMLKEGAITTQTLCFPEGSTGDEWHPIANVVKLYESKAKAPALLPLLTVPSGPVVESGVSALLGAVAVLELLAAPIVGYLVGKEDGRESLGGMIFVSGLVSGLLLLGFARVLDYLNESAQRLGRIELLLRRDQVDKPPEKP